MTQALSDLISALTAALSHDGKTTISAEIDIKISGSVTLTDKPGEGLRLSVEPAPPHRDEPA